nr:hypothetical protein [uncultured Devosia sp.]
MRSHLLALGLTLLSVPAFAAPIPKFDDPRALLVAIYDQIEAAEDWENFDSDAAFSDLDAFSTALHASFTAADAAMKADGNEMGVLDFSPFINGQDSAGMDFAVGEPKVKRDRAVIAVDITGYQPKQITFELVDEGTRGWKIDDIILPGYDGSEPERISDYFANPF